MDSPQYELFVFYFINSNVVRKKMMQINLKTVQTFWEGMKKSERTYACPLRKIRRYSQYPRYTLVLVKEYFTGPLRGCACASTCTTGREKERRGWHLRNSNIYLSTTWHSVHSCLQVQPARRIYFSFPPLRTAIFSDVRVYTSHYTAACWHSVTKRVTERNHDSQHSILSPFRDTFLNFFSNLPLGSVIFFTYRFARNNLSIHTYCTCHE